MAKDDLVGNLATETILDFLTSRGEMKEINQQAFGNALLLADQIFPKH
jgi:hydroxymethylglutaryl-CoA lyase